MPTMLSAQRVPHTFHPYPQANSFSSRNRLHFHSDHDTHTLSCGVSEKTLGTTSDYATYTAAITNLPILQELAQMSEAMDSTSVATSLLPQENNKLSSSQPSPLSDPSAASTSSAPSTGPGNLSASDDLVDSSVHFPNSAAMARDPRNAIRTLLKSNHNPCSSNLSRKYPRAPPSSFQNIIRYLKTWHPPSEYYARRRHQHPSLLYPSRRPSLPSLLEERVTQDGKLVIVCPELAMSTSLRAYQRNILPVHVSHSDSLRQRAASQGWDDDSDEDDIETDFSDEDESVGSDDDDDEAVTPINSPSSNPTYFLQPLVLTKPHGY